jgi:hypothetical protein
MPRTHALSSGAASTRVGVRSARRVMAAAAAVASGPLPPASFSFAAPLTIDHTKVPNTDQTNFPVLVYGTYAGAGGVPDLRVAGSGGHVQSASGYDIYFYASDLTTRLAAERVVWNATTGNIEAWVKIPTLSHTADTTIYVAYGDSGISTDPNSDATHGKTSVWTNGFVAVYHLPDGTTLDAHDSTANTFDATITGAVTAATGQIDGGANGFSTSKYLQLPPGMTHLTTPYSVSSWFKSTDVTQTGIITLDWSSGQRNFLFYVASSKLTGEVGNGSNAQDANLTSGTLSNSTWYHGYLTVSGTTHVLYLNGTGSSQVGSQSGGTTTNDRVIGADYAGNSHSTPFLGTLDEVRFHSAARSGDWITTEFNNQNAPSSFYTMGAEF